MHNRTLSIGGSAVRRAAATLIVTALGAMLALIAGWGATANAAPYPPSSGCTVSTTTVNAGPGDRVTVVGSGFAAGTTVTLSIPSASAALGSVTTTAKGTFEDSFTWPASVTGGSAVVQAAAASTTCSFSLINARHNSAPTTPKVAAAGLSSTGFETMTAITVAVLLLGAGAIFLGLSRRSRA